MTGSESDSSYLSVGSQIVPQIATLFQLFHHAAMSTVISQLDLHPCLRARIHPAHHNSPSPPSTTASQPSSNGFVLYFPTVCLRYEQNPSFALACHAANKLQVPLVVLAVVLDDASHASNSNPHRHPPISSQDGASVTSPLSSSVVMTSRRLAFTLQALSHACKLWSRHGAACGIRIHGTNINNSASSTVLKGARTPDHLTLATRSSLVVTDEPFVSPYTTMVHKVEEACRKSGVECVRVDGSCTVPPLQVLRKRRCNANGNDDRVVFDGVPSKAYQWQNKTEHLRNDHLKGEFLDFESSLATTF